MTEDELNEMSPSPQTISPKVTVPLALISVLWSTGVIVRVFPLAEMLQFHDWSTVMFLLNFSVIVQPDFAELPPFETVTSTCAKVLTPSFQPPEMFALALRFP